MPFTLWLRVYFDSTIYFVQQKYCLNNTKKNATTLVPAKPANPTLYITLRTFLDHKKIKKYIWLIVVRKFEYEKVK